MINHYQNICTVINDKTAKEILKKGDLLGIGLLLMDELFFDEPSDGLVLLSAQKSIEQHISREGNPNNLLLPSPHGVLGHPFADDLLNVVATTIEEKPYVILPKK